MKRNPKFELLLFLTEYNRALKDEPRRCTDNLISILTEHINPLDYLIYVKERKF